MGKPLTVEDSLVWIKLLPTLEKIKLIQQVARELELELSATPATPRKSLRGLWKGLNLTDTDIAQARQEVWKKFSREDVECPT